MTRTSVTRPTIGRTIKPAAIGLLVVSAAIIGTLVHQPASSAAPSFSAAGVPEGRGALTRPATMSAPSFNEGRRSAAATTEADGALPDGVTAFDDEYPGVANLDSDLLQALREAARDAGEDGIEIYVNSGWRSPEYQNQLLREAVSEYGSEGEAARWVATADTSPHVSGEAVDVGPFAAVAWLSEHGARYGLCQIYGNESWHYELRPDAVARGCQQPYADPPHDPRMQQ